ATDASVAAYGQPTAPFGAQRTPMMLAPSGVSGTTASRMPKPIGTPAIPQTVETVPARTAMTPPLATPVPLAEPNRVPQPSHDDVSQAASLSTTPEQTASAAARPQASSAGVTGADESVLLTPPATLPTASEPEPIDMASTDGDVTTPGLVETVTTAEERESAGSGGGVVVADAELGDAAAALPKRSYARKGGANIWLLLLGMAIAGGICLAGAFAWFRWEQNRSSPSSTIIDHAERQRTEAEPRNERDSLLATLLENRIPLIEEETVVRPMSPVQGPVTGRRSLIVDEAHAELRGPHIAMAAQPAQPKRSPERKPLKVLQTDAGLHRVEGVDEPDAPTLRSVERTTTPPVCDDVVLPETAATGRATSEHTEDLLERALLAMERERRK
ncbi:MAG: hypothetical protein ACF8TS_06165, partial [Maioricimonas sp. JB049]